MLANNFDVSVLSCSVMIFMPEGIIKYIRFSDSIETIMWKSRGAENEYIGSKSILMITLILINCGFIIKWKSCTFSFLHCILWHSDGWLFFSELLSK